MRWEETKQINSKSYVCGHCGNPLASDKRYRATRPAGGGSRTTAANIYICHRCQKPTFFKDEEQVPGPPFGGTVEHIRSKEVEALYGEARNCMKVNAYTAAAMCCRKLLMNVSVALGADEGKKFWRYIEYLKDSGYLPVNAKEWLTHIKDRGNEANHEIRIVEREDAEQLIEFSELMLKIVYEVPAKMKRGADVPPTPKTPPRTPNASRKPPYGSTF